MEKYFEHCMSHEQLEKEHKRLVIKLHPDRNPNNPNATAEFQEMQSQYEERKAELNGDYTKARKGRERREREERERKERERKEQARRRVEQVIEQARLNKQKSHRDLNIGDYIYVQQVKVTDTEHLHMYYLLRQMIENGINEECVVQIEKIFDTCADSFFGNVLNTWLCDGNVYGGWDVLQKADPANGVYKAKRVAKVVMIRTNDYCVFGNPMGDMYSFSTYYLRPDYATMFESRIKEIRERVEYEKAEKQRIEAEKQARLIAEQTPLIEEWKDKLITMSVALSGSERETVAVSNLKTMLKQKFPGVVFKVSAQKWGGMYDVKWEDGPKDEQVQQVLALFKDDGIMKLTPWQDRFGKIMIATVCTRRKMSTLTKAKILQQLGTVTEAFTANDIFDEVTVSDFDWMMLHLLVGIKVSDPNAELCMSTTHVDGSRSVSIQTAVNFVFSHSSYAKVTQKSRKSQEKVA